MRSLTDRVRICNRAYNYLVMLYYIGHCYTDLFDRKVCGYREEDILSFRISVLCSSMAMIMEIEESEERRELRHLDKIGRNKNKNKNKSFMTG